MWITRLHWKNINIQAGVRWLLRLSPYLGYCEELIGFPCLSLMLLAEASAHGRLPLQIKFKWCGGPDNGKRLIANVSDWRH